MPSLANKPIIAVDIDEVLTPHFGGLIKWYNQEYNTKLTLADNHPTDPRPWGTDNITTAVKRVHKFYETTQFLASQPYQESISSLKILSRKYSLIIVTARDTILEKVTHAWLSEHYGDLISEVHFTAMYNLEGKTREKVEVLQSIGAVYFIDDNYEHCAKAAKAGIKALLYGDYPWNKADELPERVTRVNDWQEVLEYFDGKTN